MKKRIILIFAIIISALMFGGVFSVCANSTPPLIKIEGNKIELEPLPQIKQSRTYVPIRSLIEDPALNGGISWKAEEKQVIINCRDMLIDMRIGSQRVLVNGEAHYLDVAPYIYQGRTYIPLRFIAEAIGAKVSWNQKSREANIILNQQNEVFAYYYYRVFPELKENITLFTDIAFRWYETNGKGDLFYEYQDQYQEILDFSKKHGVNCHLSVVLMGNEPLNELLASKENRSRLIKHLLKSSKDFGYDGINIDFEFIAVADKALFTQFLRELKEAMPEDQTLSVAVFARTGKENWSTPYDYVEIGKIADRVVIMAYDYSYKNSAPGPIAPYWWINDVLSYMTGIIPPEKLLLGMPTYGYDWPAGKAASSVSASKLNDIKAQYKVEEYFDKHHISPYFKYTDQQGVVHEIWMENQQSMEAKYDLAVDYNIAGISFWRIGTGFQDLYKLLEDKGL